MEIGMCLTQYMVLMSTCPFLTCYFFLQVSIILLISYRIVEYLKTFQHVCENAAYNIDDLKNEDNLENEDDPKNEDELENEDDIKNENDLKNEENLKIKTTSKGTNEYNLKIEDNLKN